MRLFKHPLDQLNDPSNEAVANEVHGQDTRYFPYVSYRKGQQEIIDGIRNLDDGKAMIIQAGTGMGKTIAMLASLLEKKRKQDKIVVFVKTINQINPILREWQKIARHRRDSKGKSNPVEEMTILPLLGRQRVCNLDYVVGNATIINCRDASWQESPYWKKEQIRDRLRRSNHRYRLVNWLNWNMLDGRISVDSFKLLLSTRENCPYENILTSLPDADIVVTTYGYLEPRNFEKLCRLMATDPENLIVCIDEAHNLAFRIPVELYKHTLVDFMNRLGATDLLISLLDQMKGVRYIDADQIIEKYMSDIAPLQKLLARILRLEDMQPPGFRDIVIEIKQFLNYIDTGRMIATRDKLVIPQVQSGRLLRLLENCRLRVLQSATISPVPAFAQLFELPADTVILDLAEYDSRKIWNRENEFRAFYSSSISSLARFRKTELFERFANLITELYWICPNHTLVLTPSYEFSEQLSSQIGTSSPAIPCIVERAKTISKELHDSIIKATQKSLIIGNQRGKILEGNEWTVDGKSIVSLVIFAGISTEVPIEEESLMIDLRNEILEDRELSTRFQQDIPLIIRAKQSLGRTRRHSTDRGALVILDDRIGSLLQENLHLRRYLKFHDLSKDLSIFSNPRMES